MRSQSQSLTCDHPGRRRRIASRLDCVGRAAAAFVGALVLTFSAPANAIVTDRPDFTESAQTAPAKRVQVEAGVRFEEGPVLSAPEILVRGGVHRLVELRFGVPSIRHSFDPALTTRGPIVIGVKVASPLGPMVNLGVLAQSSLGTSNNVDLFDEISFGGIALASVQFNERFGLGANAGVDVDTDGNATWSASLSAGVGLVGPLSAFAEFFVVGQPDDVEPAIDGGVTFALGEQLQLDGHAGYEIQAQNVFGGVGVGYLF